MSEMTIGPWILGLLVVGGGFFWALAKGGARCEIEQFLAAALRRAIREDVPGLRDVVDALYDADRDEQAAESPRRSITAAGRACCLGRAEAAMRDLHPSAESGAGWAWIACVVVLCAALLLEQCA